MSILGGRDLKPWVGAVAVAAVAGILYFLTAARDIVVGDTPELITAAVVLGVPHAPGYPLFTMLGHIFSLIPFASIPFRLNFLSVVCDSLTVGIVFLTALRLTRSQLAALVTALLLAVNPVFWSWSLAAEVFPLNNLLAALIVLLLVTWHDEPAQDGLLIGAFFTAGFALTNHQTVVLLAPAFAFVLWQRRAQFMTKPQLLLTCTVVFLVGLLPYAYIPWASAQHPAYNWGDVSSINDLFGLITRRSYGSGRLVSTAGYSGGAPLLRIGALFLSLGLVTGMLIVIGAIEAYRRQPWYFWFSVIAFICTGPIFVCIANLNLATAPSALFVLQRFFLLPQVAAAPLIGFGVLALTRLVAQVMNLKSLSALHLVTATCLVAVGITATMSSRRIDQSHNFIARHFGEDVFATAEPGSILFASGDGVAFPLMYLQKVEKIGTRTTLVMLSYLAAPWYVNQLREEHPDLSIPFDHYDAQSNNLKMLIEANPGRKIYIAGTIGNEDRSLNDGYWPYQRGLLLRIEPQSKNIPLQEMITENERLLDQYRPPEIQAVRKNTFEADILNIYAWPAFRIGNDCARVGLNDQARKWLGRARAINPSFTQAREALGRLDR